MASLVDLEDISTELLVADVLLDSSKGADVADPFRKSVGFMVKLVPSLTPRKR